MILRLGGLTVLFVDDRYDVTRFFIDRVRAEGAHVEHRKSIGAAYELLRTDTCDFAVLDLHMQMPGMLPADMVEFRSIFEHAARSEEVNRTRLNAGQILGMYINTRRGGQPPFVYLSAVAMHYVPLPGGEASDGSTCLDKYECEPEALVDVIRNATSARDAL